MRDTVINLTKGQSAIYDLFLNAMIKGRYEVILPSVINKENILSYIKLVIAENPEFYNYDTCNCSYSEQRKNCVVRMYPIFNKGTSCVDLENVANGILNNIIKESMSEVQKVLAIHDYLIKNVSYGKTPSDASSISHTAYGAIIHHKAVCEGIAYAFSYLLKKVGIASTVVDGEADGGAHAWNIVRIGTEYYHFDVTWDLLRQNGNYSMIYDYFCLSDMNIKNRIWDRRIYPKCNSRRYNYFSISDSFAHNDKDLIRIIERQYPKYGAIYLKYDYISSDKEAAMEHIWNTFLRVALKNRWSYGSVSYSINEDQSVFSLYEN